MTNPSPPGEHARAKTGQGYWMGQGNAATWG